MIWRAKPCFVVLLLLCGLAANDCVAQSAAEEDRDSVRGKVASGFMMPAGSPLEKPVRIEAGTSCIVDVKQRYVVSGTLTGTMEVDFRILVQGPCGSAPGKYDEEWIAHGTFAGETNGSSTSGHLSYTATVEAGGDVEGHIVLGQGLSGDFRVRGNFADGKLSYEGLLR